MRYLLHCLAAMVVCAFFATSAQAAELNLFAWSEYVPASVIEGFTKETGIKVNYETYASNEEMLAKLKSGTTKYDLIQPSEYTVELLIKENMLEPIDMAKVPNIKNIEPKYLNMGHDPGSKHSVPWMAGSVGIVVNTEKVKDNIAGYADVFQPKFKNRIIVLDDSREIATWAMNVLEIDYNNPPEDLSKVQQLLQKWLPLVRAYDSDAPRNALLKGDVDLGIVWSGEAAKLYQENKAFKYILPKEGAHEFIDSLCIPKGSSNKDAAHQFINYILRPEVSKLISEEFPYTNPNTEARKQLTKEQLENPASYPPGDPKLGIFKDIGDKAEAIEKMVTDLKAG